MATYNMPPRPPTPPMVTGGAPTGTPDIVGALRGQQRIGERSRNQQQMWQGLQGQFGAPTTQGPIQHIDWGNILGRGAAAYMAAKEGKKAETAEDNADKMQREFFGSVMQDDQEGARLVQMAQMGVPGADRALAEHLNPKKEALAGFIQGITSGALSPDMAAELAPRYGLSPQVGMSAAEYAKTQMEAALTREEDLKRELTETTVEGRLTAAQIAADAKGAGKGPDHIPAGTTNQRTKRLFELDDQIQNLSATDYKFDDLTKRMESDPNSFNMSWALTSALNNFENPIAQGIARRLMSPAQVELENVVMDEALSQLARLSGAVSNYEMQQIKSGLPSALQNREAAIALMKKLNEWRKTSLASLKLKRTYLSTYGFMDDSGEDMDFYNMAKKGVTTEQLSSYVKSKRPQNSPATGRQETQEMFEQEAAELGLE